MIWGKRRFELADYAPYQVRLAKLMLENPSLHSQFIMVSTATDVPNVFDYYVGVPSQTFFADFDGFVTRGYPSEGWPAQRPHLAGWGQSPVCPAGPPPVYLAGLTFSGRDASARWWRSAEPRRR